MGGSNTYDHMARCALLDKFARLLMSCAVDTNRSGMVCVRSRAAVVVLVVLAMLLDAGCSTSFATCNAPAIGRPTPTTGAPPPLPGFTLLDPPPVVDHGPRTGNLVALTFDSNMTVGMLVKLANHQASSYANLKVLDILEQEHIPATFFLTG